MDETAAWFRWVVGGVLALYGAASGWFAHLLLSNRERIHDLELEIAVLKSRPHVDPIDYATAMTNMTNAITALTLRLTEHQQLRQTQYDELHRNIAKIENQLEVITEELIALRTVNGTRHGGPTR